MHCPSFVYIELLHRELEKKKLFLVEGCVISQKCVSKQLCHFHYCLRSQWGSYLKGVSSSRPEIIKKNHAILSYSAEHEILNTYKYKNIKKFSIFHAHISQECYFPRS